MVTEGEAGFHNEKPSFPTPTHTWLKPVNHEEAGEHKLPRRRQPPKQANTTSIPLACPQCNSKRIWKDGLRYERCESREPIQRYLCRDCGFRFSESTAHLKVKVHIAAQVFKQFNSGEDFPKADIFQSGFSIQPAPQNLAFERRENVGSHFSSKVTNTEKGLNSFRDYNRDCRVCVSAGEAKNLAISETRQEKAAGATKLAEADIKGKIIQFAWKLKKEGYAESTIKTYVGAIETLVRKGTNILDPEDVKDIIAKQNWNEKSKFNYVNFYDAFSKIMGIEWKKPKYRPAEKLPFIPSEKNIDQLIYGAGRKMGALLQLIKETAMRIGEALQLQWSNIDSENNRIVLNNPEKGGSPRVFKTSSELMSRIMRLPKKSEKVFGNASRHSYEAQLLRLRKRLANQLNQAMLMKITFHTLRHWKATMQYHRTKDILYVMRFLGHRNIKNTLIYTQLIEFEAEDQYHVKVARTLKEACELVKAGFEYVTDLDEAKIFRKRR